MEKNLKLDKEDIDSFLVEIDLMSNFFKMMADPTRLKILLFLGNEEVCVNDIAAGTKTAITGFDWLGMILICFVLPAVLSVIFCELLRKIGWIKEGDLTLE